MHISDGVLFKELKCEKPILFYLIRVYGCKENELKRCAEESNSKASSDLASLILISGSALHENNM